MHVRIGPRLTYRAHATATVKVAERWDDNFFIRTQSFRTVHGSFSCAIYMALCSTLEPETSYFTWSKLSSAWNYPTNACSAARLLHMYISISLTMKRCTRHWLVDSISALIDSLTCGTSPLEKTLNLIVKNCWAFYMWRVSTNIYYQNRLLEF